METLGSKIDTTIDRYYRRVHPHVGVHSSVYCKVHHGSTSDNKLHETDCKQFLTYTRQFVAYTMVELPESCLMYGCLKSAR